MSEQLFSLMLVLTGAASGIVGSFVTMRYQHSKERAFKRKDDLLDAYKEWVAAFDQTFQYGLDFCLYEPTHPVQANIYGDKFDHSYGTLKTAEAKVLLLERNEEFRNQIEEFIKDIDIFTPFTESLLNPDKKPTEVAKQILDKSDVVKKKFNNFTKQLANSNHFV